MNRLQPQPIETLIVRDLVHDRIFAGILRERGDESGTGTIDKCGTKAGRG